MNLLKNLTQSPKDDVLAGMTVSLAMIPEVVAFAFVAKINPIVALSGAFIIGLISSILGGRPGLISGAAGAVAVIFVEMIQEGHEKGLAMKTPIENLGYFYLFAAVILMGIIQIVAGYFKLGKFVRLIPHPVMLGFVNGLAVVIGWAQIKMFKHKLEKPIIIDGEKIDSIWMEGYELYTMVFLVAITMLLIYSLPKLSKKIPASLTAIITVTLGVVFFGGDYEIMTVGSYIKEGGGDGLKGEIPSLNLALFQNLPFNFDTLKLIALPAFLAAAVGLIESLMTMNLVDEITETKGNGNKECIAQGVGNIVSGLFGGTGGCGMIGQTMVNINAKGRGKLSGIVMALTLLSFILFADKYIERVPIAALVGVMFVMVIDTFAWSSLRILRKIPVSDAVVLISVSIITVVVDLAVAVFIGVIISALSFAWQNAIRIRARKSIKVDGTKVYEIWGPLFFGSTLSFNSKFDPKNDPEKIEINFLESKVSDHSGIEAVRGIARKYLDLKKEIKLTYLSPDCKKLLIKANPKFEEVIETSIDDPRYYVVTDMRDLEV